MDKRASYEKAAPIGGSRGPRGDDWNQVVDARSGGERGRDNWDDRGNRQRNNSSLLSGANSVPVKIEPSHSGQRRDKSPQANRDRGGGSRERLLPPQALPMQRSAPADYNRGEDRRSGGGLDRDRSPRDRNSTRTGDHFDRRPRENKGSFDRSMPRRDRGNEGFGQRQHDKDLALPRSASREGKISDFDTRTGGKKMQGYCM